MCSGCSLTNRERFLRIEKAKERDKRERKKDVRKSERKRCVFCCLDRRQKPSTVGEATMRRTRDEEDDKRREEERMRRDKNGEEKTIAKKREE